MATELKTDVMLRLKKIEGQIRGLQRMIDENTDCREVVNQLAAARKALDKVGFLILSHRMQECIQNRGAEGGSDTALEEAMNLFLTLA